MTIVSNISWILLMFGCHGCGSCKRNSLPDGKKTGTIYGSISAYNKKKCPAQHFPSS